MSDELREVMTVEEVAEFLRVKEATVTQWIRQGRLKAARPGGPDSPYRVRRRIVEAWLVAQEESGP